MPTPSHIRLFNPPRDLPPLRETASLRTMQATQAIIAGHTPTTEYDAAPKTISSSLTNPLNYTPGHNNVGVQLLEPQHVAKISLVYTCFERLASLAELGKKSPRGTPLSPGINIGATFCNMMLIHLACEASPKNSPIRDLCSYGQTSRVRSFWAHEFYPKMNSNNATHFDCEAVLQAIKPMTMTFGSLPHDTDYQKAKNIITKLFEACSIAEFLAASDTSPRLLVAAFNDNPEDPRQFFADKIAIYLSLINEGFEELEKLKTQDAESEINNHQGAILDALLFYVSRVGELSKHLAFSAKHHQAIRDELLHIFDGEIYHENLMTKRDILHAKLLSSKSDLTTLQIPENVLAGDWQPFINSKFDYDDHTLTQLLDWRLQSLKETQRIGVHDTVNLTDLPSLHKKISEYFTTHAKENTRIIVVPICMPLKKLSC